MITPSTPRELVTEIAEGRDPDGFARLLALSQSAGINAHTAGLALRGVASIMAAKGGGVTDIVVGDCLELLRVLEDLHARQAACSPYFYQLLCSAGVFAEAHRRHGVYAPRDS